MWTQDLPLGGESNIGRGRLQGVAGTLCFNQGDTITLTPEGIDPNLRDMLEDHVRQLHNYPREL